MENVNHQYAALRKSSLTN